ncbi:MAG TPA: hypothetical protein VIN04_02230 [Myxococcota bacterium]
MRRAARLATGLLACALAAAPVAVRAAIVVDSSDPRCMALPGPFPPGLDWIDPAAGVALVVNSENDAVAAPVDFTRTPPATTAPAAPPELRPAIADDACAGQRYPLLDGAHVVSPALALVTGSSCESVAFLDPATGALRHASVSTPASLAAGVFPYLPAPGAAASAPGRVALSTRMCVDAPPGTLDSKGAPIPYDCGRGVPSYYTSFTSGAAVAAGRLFVSTANLGAGAGTFDPQFLPGTVLVFELSEEPLAAAPHPVTPVIFTRAFNPTSVAAYTTPQGRELVLVGASGALGLVQDDPGTPYREAGGAALTEAAIDVIDAEQLRLIATIPLGLAGLAFERLAIDPSGRVALVGSAIARHVYAVDLRPLDALAPDAPWARLDGVDGPAAAIFDAGHPLVLPGLANGAPPATCPGYVVGVEWGASRTAYATDFCDGTITRIRVDSLAAPEVPLSRARFTVEGAIELVAPVGPQSLGKAQAPGALRVFADGDAERAAVIVGYPEGLACSVPVPEPASAALGAASLLALCSLAARRARERGHRNPKEDTR